MQKISLKKLTTAISSIMAMITASIPTYATDTEIYQAPKKGNVTLMLVLDVSGSMHQCDTDTRTIPGGARVLWSTCQHNGQTLDSRFSLVKKAMQDLLRGNPTKNIDALDDDKIIGLATLGAGGYTGEVLIPAKPLGSKTDQNSHRYVLLRRIENLQANSWTPTAYSYAEVASYLMGTSTIKTYNDFNKTPRPNHYHWQISGFERSATDTKTADRTKYLSPNSLNQPEDSKQCNGQGIYMLTDGEPNHGRMAETIMKESLGNKANIFSCGGIPSNNASPDYTTGWTCIHEYAKTLLDPDKNPKNLKFKTAVVGFGRTFTTVLKTPYDPKKTKDDNIAALGRIDNDAKRAAEWGIIGEGGWYAGSKSQDVVDSVNHFIASLTEDIPDVVTGQPAIPIDPLNPLKLMKQGFYGTFIPKVGINQSFWLGNMNKYHVRNNMLYGTSNQALFKSDGLVSSVAIGLWGNGMVSKLPLRSDNTTTFRQVFTNETPNNDNLTRVTVNALYDPSTSLGAPSASANRNAWLNLLGYNIPLLDNSSPSIPVSQTSLTTQPELRQAGALLHSTPIILTQSGKINSIGGALDTSTNRKDYVLYGSTQGILHVIDSETGIEKIAFVPKEMMTNQKESFQHIDNARGVMKYGIDGQWVAYTQYVSDGSNGFTVKGSSIPSSSSDLSGKGLQWVYGGLRMGGRSYYALDLTDIDNPKLKFHINPDGVATSSPLSYMGQSWSKPSLGFVNWKGSKRLVMFVGGGYDEGYENRTYEQTNGKGAGVYMFDAHNGELLWWGSSHAANNTRSAIQSTNNPALKYSVVSSIGTFDRNNDGLVDNLYFADLGGQVFRVDLDNTHTITDSLVTRIVRLYNGHQAGGLSPRFYETPSLSAHSGLGATGQFGIVSIASGNRSSPLAEGNESARDALFVLYDHDVFKPKMVKKNTTLVVTDAAEDKLVENNKTRMASGNESQQIKAVDGTNHKQGWKYYLSTNAGELKGYSSPRVVDNFLFLTTYTPRGGTTIQNSCNAGILGESFQEVFCLPGGVCSVVDGKDQKVILQEANINSTNNGSAYRFQLGIGIVQPGIGNISDKTPNKHGTISPKGIDCTNDANKNKLECLTEVSNITNRPVRWYEDSPRAR